MNCNIRFATLSHIKMTYIQISGDIWSYGDGSLSPDCFVNCIIIGSSFIF
jgi:hypothetical protein